MSLKQKIYKQRSKLNSSELNIVKALLSDPKCNSQLSLSKLAKKLFVSESAIFRLCKKLGLSGYSEMKFELAHLSEESKKENNVNLIEQITNAANMTIKQFKRIDLNSFFQTLHNAQTVYLYSTGWQQELIADYFAKSLFLVGKKAVVLPSALDELKRCSSWSNKGDILCVISYSGNNLGVYEELKNLSLVDDNLKVVSMSKLGANKISTLADYNFFFETINFSYNTGFTNEKISFSPAYIYIDLLVSNYYLWIKESHTDD